jgi:hypothetical protein
MALTPDPFSLSPLLSVLPALGNVSRLESLVTSLFARYESVEAQREHTDVVETRTKLASEAAMLRQILDWLAVQPEETGGSDE